jgi:exosortase A
MKRLTVNLLLLVAGFIALGVAWFDTVNHLFHIIWTVDTFSHGLFVPLISLGLIWARRETLLTIPKEISLSGIGVIVVTACLWTVGHAAEVRLFEHIALIAAIQGLLVTTLGWQFYRAILFPALFLFLMVPFGQSIVTPLQILTAEVVISLLNLLGVEYQAEGVLITLSSGLYEVAQACAGVRFFFTSLVTGILLSHLVFQNIYRRIGIIFASMVVPVFANIIRVLTILLIAENTDQSFAKDVDHIVYGWGFLSVVLIILIIVAYRFSDVETTQGNTGVKTPLKAVAKPNTGFMIIIATAAVLIPLFTAILVTGQPVYRASALKITALDCRDCEYRVLKNTALQYVPKFYDLDHEQSVTLRRGADFIFAFAGGYDDQIGDKNLLRYYDTFDTDGWQQLPIGNAKLHTINNTSFAEKLFWHGDERLIVFYSYQIGDQWLATADWQVKIYSALSRLQTGSAPASIIVVAARVNDNIDNARSILTEYIQSLGIKHQGGRD